MRDEGILLILFSSILFRNLKSATQPKLNKDLKLVAKIPIVYCISLNHK